MLKTFWGWRDEQLADATLIWTAPSGARYVTHPGSAYLFPGWCAPTAPVTATPTAQPCGDRSVMMPRRRRTRAQERATAIAAERAHNHRMRTEPPVPAHVPDEDLVYDDTLTKEPEPPPF